MSGKIFSIILFSIIVISVSGCGTVRRITFPPEYTYFPVSNENIGITKQYPKSYTIYPFMNTSWDQHAAKRARMAIYKSFSLIGKTPLMSETDRLASSPYTLADAIRVAKREKCDAVVVGEVLEQEQSFLFLYTYNYVKVKITIYDVRTSLPLWKGSSWGYANEFGGLIFWIPNPILPLIKNIFWSRITMDLYNRISMDIVHSIRPDIIKIED